MAHIPRTYVPVAGTEPTATPWSLQYHLVQYKAVDHENTPLSRPASRSSAGLVSA